MTPDQRQVVHDPPATIIRANPGSARKAQTATHQHIDTILAGLNEA